MNATNRPPSLLEIAAMAGLPTPSLMNPKVIRQLWISVLEVQSVERIPLVKLKIRVFRQGDG